MIFELKLNIEICLWSKKENGSHQNMNFTLFMLFFVQVEYFEQVLREAHSHPQVHGIIMWTGRTPEGCYRICLTDNNFKNLPAGDVVDKLLHEWGLGKLSAKTDQNGFLDVSLFHGDYKLEINHPVKNYSFTHHLQVNPIDESKETTQFVKLSI